MCISWPHETCQCVDLEIPILFLRHKRKDLLPKLSKINTQIINTLWKNNNKEKKKEKEEKVTWPWKCSIIEGSCFYPLQCAVCCIPHIWVRISRTSSRIHLNSLLFEILHFFERRDAVSISNKENPKSCTSRRCCFPGSALLECCNPEQTALVGCGGEKGWLCPNIINAKFT